MRIVILGSGAQGTGLAGLLAMEPDVEKIILADYSTASLDKAHALLDTIKNRFNNTIIEYKTVNAGDTDEVADIIRGNDFCFHAILPRFNLPIMEACLREKVHYSDLIALPGQDRNDPQTIGAQKALHDRFKDAGILAIPSVGISPGWTLFAAADMIEGFDEVREVIIRYADYLDTDAFTSSITPSFMLGEWLGSPGPTAYRNGSLVLEDLFESEEEFEFPAPIGKQLVYTVTSQPDIVMIPDLSPLPIPYCVEKGGFSTRKLHTKDIWIQALQKTASKGERLKEGADILDELGKTIIPPNQHDELFKKGLIRDHATCFSVEVNGRKATHFVRHIQYNTCTKATAVKYLPWSTPAVYDTIGGLPLILILMVCRNEISQRGVLSAGELGIADRIRYELAKRDHDITEKIIIETEKK